MTANTKERQLAVAVLILPDDRLALQRRSTDAPIAPGKLGFFGGHMEDSEDPLAAVKRELAEETSLDIELLDLKFIREISLEADSESGPLMLHFYVYKAEIPTDNFAVYEGVGVESYLPQELLVRGDVSLVVRKVVEEHVKQA